MNVDVGTDILEEIGGFLSDIIYSSPLRLAGERLEVEVFLCYLVSGDGKLPILSSVPVGNRPFPYSLHNKPKARKKEERDGRKGK